MTTTLILLAPFVGTVIGASTVLFARRSVSLRLQNALLGFAAGVMVAASVWSLIIPAIELSEGMGRMSWMPAAIGIILGMLFLLGLDSLIPHQHPTSDTREGLSSSLGKRQMLMLAVTLHNIPEGMAVGAVVAGALTGDAGISMAAATARGAPWRSNCTSPSSTAKPIPCSKMTAKTPSTAAAKVLTKSGGRARPWKANTKMP